MKKKKMIITAAVLAIIAVIGGTLAYFTDEDHATNVFTLGNVDIELTEPNWNEDNAKDLIPGETIAKDPQVTVKAGSADSYIFLKVDVPTVQANTTAIAPFNLPIFTYNVEGGNNQYYRLVAEQPESDDPEYFSDENQELFGSNQNYHSYIYALTEYAGSPEETSNHLAKVKAGETTIPIFNSVKVTDKIGNGIYNLDNDSYNLRVTAYAIQADGLDEDFTYNNGNIDVAFDSKDAATTEQLLRLYKLVAPKMN